jgi:demethylspheroidene O-methyltransferase
VSDTAPPLPRRGLRWPSLARTVASPGFQSWAARFPLTKGLVRREGDAMMDLVAGFVHSQVLAALVDFGTLDAIIDAPRSTDALARLASVPPVRMGVLLRAAAGLGLIRDRRGQWHATLRGAALAGVPGLAGMIRHHAVLYRDLADPAAFFRGQTDTELARFWPYVFGAGAAEDPDRAARYSQLMADSQALVAEDTLAAVSLKGVRRLMDVGGGTGAFLTAAGLRWPDLRLRLVDLPAVVPGALGRFASAGLSDRAEVMPLSFRDAALPPGADAVSLVRVLYDHQDDTVRDLLAKVHAALPPGGRVIVSEPMAGGPRPDRAGDAYFAPYCLAMNTGMARSSAEIGSLLVQAGFTTLRAPRPARPFVTSVIEARRP